MFSDALVVWRRAACPERALSRSRGPGHLRRPFAFLFACSPACASSARYHANFSCTAGPSCVSPRVENDSSRGSARPLLPVCRVDEEARAPKAHDPSRRLGKLYGVKGLPILSRLSSLDLAIFCPYDFMHIIWENLIKNLILLWTDESKGLDQGTGTYTLDTDVWNAIVAAKHESGKTIPCCFGARPPNFRTDKQPMTADTWSFWTLYLGPVLLRHQFSDPKYYRRFVRLVKLLHLCLQFKVKREEITEVREGFIRWFQEYEECAYGLC